MPDKGLEESMGGGALQSTEVLYSDQETMPPWPVCAGRRASSRRAPPVFCQALTLALPAGGFPNGASTPPPQRPSAGSPTLRAQLPQRAVDSRIPRLSLGFSEKGAWAQDTWVGVGVPHGDSLPRQPRGRLPKEWTLGISPDPRPYTCQPLGCTDRQVFGLWGL